MPTAEEAGADEIPVPAEMQDTGKEPEPAEKYGVDTLEEASPPQRKATGASRRSKRTLRLNLHRLRRRHPPKVTVRSFLN